MFGIVQPGEGEDDDLVFEDALNAAPHRTKEKRSPQWGWPWDAMNEGSSRTTTTTTAQNHQGRFSDDEDYDLEGSGHHGDLEGSGDLPDSFTLGQILTMWEIQSLVSVEKGINSVC
ncbi:unnamed protein product [Darwinula stevensoni]|uniref:Uncharacterized protein n=1 Tax=Darwinula stevensoni TaxID=69355 RepID=A0A7R9A8K3_9CRUS|nr:unnamed protein product [Darwinula stevensoni]CAG0896553.1 unnamed protein product [Darwinula stevensoni]